MDSRTVGRLAVRDLLARVGGRVPARRMAGALPRRSRVVTFAGELIGAAADLLQRRVEHPPGDVVHRDGHAGQGGSAGGCDAAVKAGDREVAADAQALLGGDGVDRGGSRSLLVMTAPAGPTR